MRNTKTKLTPREIEVLNLCAKGYSNPQIADALTISPHTVKAHLGNIFEKLKVSSRMIAVLKAVKLNLL